MTMQNNMQNIMQNMHISFFSSIQNMQDNCKICKKKPAEYAKQNMQITMQNMHIPFFLMQNMQDNMQNMQINIEKICIICKKNMKIFTFVYTKF